MKRCSPCLRFALAAAVLAAALLGCRQAPATGDPASLTTTATVTRGTMSDVVQLGGQVVALNSRTLTFGTVGGKVLDLNARVGRIVQKGQALARIETTDQERQWREAQADLKVAEAVLADAQHTSAGAGLLRAEAESAAAQVELDSARLKLTVARQLGTAPLEEAVADAQVALQASRDQLRQTELGGNQSSIRTLEYQQAFFQRVLRDARPGEDTSKTREGLAAVERDLAGARAARDDSLRTARDAVTKAEEDLAQAQASLKRAKSGEEDPTVAARLAYEQAAANAERARKKLEDLKVGGDSDTVKAAKTAYDAAKAKVESAKEGITASTLVAPFGGVVFAVYVKVDDRVLPNTNILYLADPKELRIQAQATDMDVAHLAVGQDVRVTFDAYPGKVFSGKVLSLPVSGKPAGGMSTYQIEASLSQGEADIRPGSFANLRVVIGEKKDVLMIPAAALVYGANNEASALVRTADGKVQTQKVEIGLNDGIMAEVLGGALSEGQTIIVPLVPPTDPRRSGPMGPASGPVVIERVG